jgi:hypothetical protein
MGTYRLPAILVSVLVAGIAGIASGCGAGNDSLAVKEGAPLHLGGLDYNVVITRYLNPKDVEDKAYLRGAPALPRDDYYLGVFMEVDNTSDTTQSLPQGMTIYDTEGNTFRPVALKNDFSLTLGSSLGAGSQLPDPESAAANGPIQGSMLLFLLSSAATENRPLELQIPSESGEAGEIQLDL